MLGFVLDADTGQAATVVDRLRLIAVARGLGGVESLVTRPISTTHHGLDPAERAKRGIADSTVLLSGGPEDADDLIADLAQALATDWPPCSPPASLTASSGRET